MRPPVCSRPYGPDCPVCGRAYSLQCKCLRGDRVCPEGHHWFRCRGCGKAVVGPSDHGDPEGGFCSTCRPKQEKAK